MYGNQNIVSANTENVGDGISSTRVTSNNRDGINIISSVTIRPPNATMPGTSASVTIPAAPQNVPARNEGEITGDAERMVTGVNIHEGGAGGAGIETNGGDSILRSCLLYGSKVYHQSGSNMVTDTADNGDEVPLPSNTPNSDSEFNLSQIISQANDSKIDLRLKDLYSELEQLGNNCITEPSVMDLQHQAELTEAEVAVKHLLEAEGGPSTSTAVHASCKESTISQVMDASPEKLMESQEPRTPCSLQFSQASSNAKSVIAFDDDDDDDFVETFKPRAKNNTNCQKIRSGRGLGAFGKRIKMTEKVTTESHIGGSSTPLAETLSEDEFVLTEPKRLVKCKGKCAPSKKGFSKRCNLKVLPSTSSGGALSEDEFVPTEAKRVVKGKNKFHHSSSKKVSTEMYSQRSPSQDSAIFSQPDHQEALNKLKKLKRSIVEEIEEYEERLSAVVTSRKRIKTDLAAQEHTVEQLRLNLQQAEETLFHMQQADEREGEEEEKCRQRLAKICRKKRKLQRAFSDFFD